MTGPQTSGFRKVNMSSLLRLNQQDGTLQAMMMVHDTIPPSALCPLSGVAEGKGMVRRGHYERPDKTAVKTSYARTLLEF